MSSYTGVDFYRLDRNLSEEERSVRDTVRRFVDQKFLPGIRDHFREGTFPLELIPELGSLGLLGPAVQGPGCPGLSYTMYGLICEELERGDSGLRSFASVQGSLVMWPIATYGTDEQKQKWLPELAAGRKIGCFGLTEANHGSDPGRHGNPGRARRRGLDPQRQQAVDHQRRPGRRGGGLGPRRRGRPRLPGGKGHARVSAPTPSTASTACGPVTRANWSSTRCGCPTAAGCPDARGLKAPLSCLNEARYGIAWGVIGAAADCYTTALRYGQERHQFGKPLAGFQLVQQKLVTMLTEITKAQALCQQLGRLKDAGINEVPLVSLAKRNNVAMALECARTARDILGAAGVTDEFSPGRHMANLESVITYEGTHDIHTLIVGAEITGLPAFR